MDKENKSIIHPDDDWFVFIPDKEWMAIHNLCDKLEQTRTEFQKVLEKMEKVDNLAPVN